VLLYWSPRKVQELSARVLCLPYYGGSSSSSPSFSGMILACSFYSLKEVQGYKMLAYGVTLLVEEPGGLERALSGGDVAATMEAWCCTFGTAATCQA
jgi:hypothetical protein